MTITVTGPKTRASSRATTSISISVPVLVLVPVLVRITITILLTIDSPAYIFGTSSHTSICASTTSIGTSASITPQTTLGALGPILNASNLPKKPSKGDLSFQIGLQSRLEQTLRTLLND